MSEQFVFEGHNLGVVGVSAHGNKAASVGLDCTIRFWNLENGEDLGIIEGGPSDAWSICFSPDGTRIATGANGGNVQVEYFKTKKVELIKIWNTFMKIVNSFFFERGNPF